MIKKIEDWWYFLDNEQKLFTKLLPVIFFLLLALIVQGIIYENEIHALKMEIARCVIENN